MRRTDRADAARAPRATRRAARHRRGFTLPLVMMLLLISGMFLALLTQRMVNSALAARRAANTYTFHHISLGIQESVEAWVDSNGRRPLAESLGPDGEAFELVVEGGQRVTVRFRDAQGLALGELSGIGEQQAESAAAVMVSLVERTDAQRARAFIRTEGPVAISVATAPEVVLLAAVDSVTKGRGTRDLVEQILRLRESSFVSEEDLTRVIEDAGLEATAQNRLRQLLTATPQLWEVVAEAEPLPGATSTLASSRIRYGGLAYLAPPGRARSAQDRMSLERKSRFIRWRELTDDVPADRPL